jgi:hypothetical protein
LERFFPRSTGTFQLHNAIRWRENGNSTLTTWDTGAHIDHTAKHTGLLFISSESCYDSAQKAWDTRLDSMRVGPAGKRLSNEKTLPAHLHRMDSKGKARQKKNQIGKPLRIGIGHPRTSEIGDWLSQYSTGTWVLKFAELRNRGSLDGTKKGQLLAQRKRLHTSRPRWAGFTFVYVY